MWNSQAFLLSSEEGHFSALPGCFWSTARVAAAKGLQEMSGGDSGFDWSELAGLSNASLSSLDCGDRLGTGDLLTHAEAMLFKYYQLRQQRNEELFQTKAKEKKFLALLSLSLQNANEGSSSDNVVVNSNIKSGDEQYGDDEEEHRSKEPLTAAAAVNVKEERRDDVPPPIERKQPPVAPPLPTSGAFEIPLFEEPSKYLPVSSSAPIAATAAASEPNKIAKRKIGELSAPSASGAAKKEDPHKVFSTPGLLLLEDWDPRKVEEALYFALPGFSFDANQTLAFKVSVRSDFKRWSFNIAPANHEHYNNILLHFAPSYHKKRAEHQLVLNDKAGTWGSGLKESFRVNDPLTPSSRVMQVVVRIETAGFFVFANDKFRSFFPHRRDITSFTDLSFFILNRDENGNPEEAIVHSVWWGRTDREDRSRLVPDMALLTGNMSEYMIPAVPFSLVTIVVRGLPVINDYHEIQFVEAALRDVFDEFGPVSINVVRGLSTAYVRLALAEAVGRAIAELDGAAIQDSAGAEMVLRLQRYE